MTIHTPSRLYVSSLRTEHLGHQRYRLTSPLVMRGSLTGGSFSLTVPVGFVTDFASIPTLLQLWLPFDGPWAEAAVFHDWLYSRGRCSRFLADAIFREAMDAMGVPWLKRTLMYYAVRIFGAWFFRKAGVEDESSETVCGVARGCEEGRQGGSEGREG